MIAVEADVKNLFYFGLGMSEVVKRKQSYYKQVQWKCNHFSRHEESISISSGERPLKSLGKVDWTSGLNLTFSLIELLQFVTSQSYSTIFREI